MHCAIRGYRTRAQALGWEVAYREVGRPTTPLPGPGRVGRLFVNLTPAVNLRLAYSAQAGREQPRELVVSVAPSRFRRKRSMPPALSADTYNVFKNAISSALASASSPTPNRWPGTARRFTL